MQQKTLDSFDGTRLVYRVGGRGRRWLVVANGYGGTFCAWDEIFAQLAPHYRLMTWDYRGTHRSAIPVDRGKLRVEDSCRDLELLLEVEGIERMVLAGWSVGVQVALEYYRRRSDTVEALVLVNGAHGRLLHRCLDGRLAARVLPAGLPLLTPALPLLARTLQPVLRQVFRSGATLELAALIGAVHGRSASFHEALQRFMDLDFAVYFEMARLADAHDADDLLPQIGVPTLVTAGDHDLLVPRWVSRHQSRSIPGATYFEIPGGTHYSTMEFPRLLANRIHSFVQDRLEPPRAAPGLSDS